MEKVGSNERIDGSMNTYYDPHHPGERGLDIGDQNHKGNQAEARDEFEGAEDHLHVSRPSNPPFRRAAHGTEPCGSAGGDLLCTVQRTAIL